MTASRVPAGVFAPVATTFGPDGELDLGAYESNLDAYFDDFVDDNPTRFVERLYETLRADLPKYEVENKS